MSEVTENDARRWQWGLVLRCRIARNARHLSYGEAGTITGLGSAIQKLEWALLDGGDADVAHVRLDHLVPMAVGYRAALRDLLDGWPGWQTGTKPPARPEPMYFPSLDVCDGRVRRNLATARAAKGYSLRLVAQSVAGTESWAAALQRLEKGTANHVHLDRLYQLASLYDVSIANLILTDMEQAP